MKKLVLFLIFVPLIINAMDQNGAPTKKSWENIPLRSSQEKQIHGDLKKINNPPVQVTMTRNQNPQHKECADKMEEACCWIWCCPCMCAFYLYAASQAGC